MGTPMILHWHQLVVAMPLVQAICNVLILLVSVLAMLVIKGPSVMLLVVAIPLVQAALHVTNQQVNVLAILDTLESHVIPVMPITIKQVMMLLVHVSSLLKYALVNYEYLKCIYFSL